MATDQRVPTPENEPDSYEAAQRELQALLRALQDEEPNLDQLTERVRRARYLLDWSRTRLRAVEAEVAGLLDGSSVDASG